MEYPRKNETQSLDYTWCLFTNLGPFLDAWGLRFGLLFNSKELKRLAGCVSDVRRAAAARTQDQDNISQGAATPAATQHEKSFARELAQCLLVVAGDVCWITYARTIVFVVVIFFVTSSPASPSSPIAWATRALSQYHDHTKHESESERPSQTWRDLGKKHGKKQRPQ